MKAKPPSFLCFYFSGLNNKCVALTTSKPITKSDNTSDNQKHNMFQYVVIFPQNVNQHSETR